MAVVTTKSTTLTNRDAVPQVINDARLERGVLKSAIGSVTAANGDSIGSKYVLASLPSNAMVRQLQLSSGAVTGAAANVGVYRATRDGGAAVSASLFGAAVSLNAAQGNADVTNQSGTYTPALQEQPLWQAAGLAADPASPLDIVLTLTAGAGASALVGVKVTYVDGGS